MAIAGPLLLLGLAWGAPLPADSQAAMEAGSCALCHEVPGAAQASLIEGCAACHQYFLAAGANPAASAKGREVFPLWDRYQANLVSYRAVPSLEAAMARLDPNWVRGWLADPHDLRPGLNEGMPRFGLTDAQLDAIARGFATRTVEIPPTPAPDPDQIPLGLELLVTRGCTGCHAVGALSKVATLPLAPDLAGVRERLSPDMAAAWIANPSVISPAATMPSLGLLPDQVLAIRDALFLADLEAPPAVGPGPLPPPAARPVAWAEVEDRVFGRICVHCHMDPDLNEGRAGPGNAGGFGWQATGIALQTREQVAAMAEKIPDALARRREEAARDHVSAGFAPVEGVRPELPGMPLGLAPLSDEDTALVLAWIAQGCPG